ncbi:MAG: 5-formyltetrahydrofolate cyclo-ligase [Verrucomicrobiota bacterium]|jgi:5-formyltetrahydrofolate cyclo-ligase
MANPETKAELRQQIRAALGRVSLAVRLAESLDLCARLEPQLQSAHTILFFAPLVDELDVWPLLEKLLPAKKICALPAFDAALQFYSARRVKSLETDIVTGKFGVSEPLPECEQIPLDRFDLVLVPGVAFDLGGNRLGRGRGFYDRILAVASGVKCGVAYDFQLLEKIPAEAHDAKVNFIFTPTRCVRRSG